MRNVIIIIIGIGIGFINTIFLQSFGQIISSVINIFALLFILIGIAGVFREQI